MKGRAMKRGGVILVVLLGVSASASTLAFAQNAVGGPKRQTAIGGPARQYPIGGPVQQGATVVTPTKGGSTTVSKPSMTSTAVSPPPPGSTAATPPSPPPTTTAPTSVVKCAVKGACVGPTKDPAKPTPPPAKRTRAA